MTSHPYGVEHIATDPLHLKREARYAVVRRSDGTTVSKWIWSGAARDEANRLNGEAGACQRCHGDGSVIGDYIASPDGDIPIGADCERCGGTRREPTP